MAQTSRPWQGTTIGDAGAYSSAQWAQTWDHLIGNGDFANKGIIKNIDSDLLVQATSPASTSVEILAGAAIVNGRYYYNDATVTQAIASNASGSTRYDYIVLEADYTAQTVRIAIVQGTPGGGLPSLTQNVNIWQIPLAYIELASGYSSIANSVITDYRTFANIPQNVGSEIINNSGGTLESGNVVIWDTVAGDNNIDTSTTDGDPLIAGVIEARVANGGTGKIIQSGIFSVLCDESVSVGDVLEISSTAGEAQAQVTGATLPFARVLTANTGANTKALCYINHLPKMGVDSGYVELTNTVNQNPATTTITKILWDTITTESLDTGDTANNRIILNSDGVVLITLLIKGDGLAGNATPFAIYVNGSPILSTTLRGTLATDPFFGAPIEGVETINVLYNGTKNDYIEGFIYKLVASPQILAGSKLMVKRIL